LVLRRSKGDSTKAPANPAHPPAIRVLDTGSGCLFGIIAISTLKKEDEKKEGRKEGRERIRWGTYAISVFGESEELEGGLVGGKEDGVEGHKANKGRRNAAIQSDETFLCDRLFDAVSKTSVCSLGR